MRFAKAIATTLEAFYCIRIHHNDSTTNMLYDKEIDLVYLIDFGRAGCAGSVVNDLAYLLDSIVKEMYWWYA